jgi:DNA-binding NarL/FixJ family response regulator
MIRVVLADDHEVIRAGLRRLLELAGDVTMVAEASTGRETVAKVTSAPPDVLLLDIRMPDGDGLFVLQELARRSIMTPALVLTTFDDIDVALHAIELGARGYLLKDVTIERLLAAVRALAGGGTWFSPGIGEEARRRISTPRAVTVPDGAPVATEEMTAREREVLRLLAGGYSNREIGVALHVAEGTVKNHVSSILAKLGVRDRTRAVLKAAERGYV